MTEIATFCKCAYHGGVPALQSFLKDELGRRGWSVEEFVNRAGLSLSSGYLIIRDGKDNVRQDTFEGIAAAFSMTPAELMVAIGKGPSGTDPHEVVHIGLYRQVPSEQKFSATAMLRGLILNPAQAPAAAATTSEVGSDSSAHKRADSSRPRSRRSQFKPESPDASSLPSEDTVEHHSHRLNLYELTQFRSLASA